MIPRMVSLDCEIAQILSASALFLNIVITYVLTPGIRLPLSVSSYNLGSDFTMSKRSLPGSWIYYYYMLAHSPPSSFTFRWSNCW